MEKKEYIFDGEVVVLEKKKRAGIEPLYRTRDGYSVIARKRTKKEEAEALMEDYVYHFYCEPPVW